MGCMFKVRMFSGSTLIRAGREGGNNVQWESVGFTLVTKPQLTSWGALEWDGPLELS